MRNRNENAIMIRYCGPDHARKFCIQRGDDMFWDGDNWVESEKHAKMYSDHKTAQAACGVLQYRKHKGKACRQFTMNMIVTVIDEDVQNISKADIIKYIVNAMRLDIETSVYGDGPTPDSYFVARLQTQTLEECKPAKSHY